MQILCVQVSAWISQVLAPDEDRDLAPGFGQILALDESKLDAMKRWISELRALPNGDPLLLAGRMSVLFDVRRQCVRRLDLLPQASEHSCVHARRMIEGLQKGTLLLFGLGYYVFAWFDELTARGWWWISRIKSNSSFVIQRVLIERDGYREEIVQLGASRSDHAAFSARLIALRYHGVWYRYLTNVLDPRMLSGAQVARLYGRRWDIELAFRTLKDHLNLRMLWSAKTEVIAVQVWATLIVAQLCSCSQVQVVAEAGVEIFDVSLELLLRELPRLLAKGIDPVPVSHVRFLAMICVSIVGLLPMYRCFVYHVMITVPLATAIVKRRRLFELVGVNAARDGRYAVSCPDGRLVVDQRMIGFLSYSVYL